MNPVQKEKLEKMNVMLNATLTNLVGVMNEVRTTIALNNDIISGGTAPQVLEPVKEEPVSLPVSKLPSLLESIGSAVSTLPVPAPIHPSSKLFTSESPLLDLFAASHFFPKGRGAVYPESPGFKWIRTIEVTEANASSVPSGFYGDSIRNIVIRLESYILLIKVESGVDVLANPDSILVFVAGVSEAPPGGVEKWYSARALPATPSKKLTEELQALAAAYRAA